MRLLIDTHAFLWFISGDDQLSSRARGLICDEENEILLSVGSLWEIVIKVSLGKLRLTGTFEDVIPHQIESNDIEILGIKVPHLVELSRLPQFHRDPFDRLMIAQAMAEGVPLVGKDGAFEDYPLQLLW